MKTDGLKMMFRVLQTEQNDKKVKTANKKVNGFKSNRSEGGECQSKDTYTFRKIHGSTEIADQFKISSNQMICDITVKE